MMKYEMVGQALLSCLCWVVATAAEPVVPVPGGEGASPPAAAHRNAPAFRTLPESARSYRVRRMAEALVALAAEGTPASVERVRRRLLRGVPPEVLAAVLAAVRSAPQPMHAPLLEDLASHRAPEVRGKALAALAMVDPGRARPVVARARFDAHPGVARVAALLAERLGLPPAARSSLGEQRPSVLAPERLGPGTVDLVVDLDAPTEMGGHPAATGPVARAPALTHPVEGERP